MWRITRLTPSRSSIDEHHMELMRHGSVDYGDPNEPRRKRQKFHRSRTACFPVSRLSLSLSLVLLRVPLEVQLV